MKRIIPALALVGVGFEPAQLLAAYRLGFLDCRRLSAQSRATGFTLVEVAWDSSWRGRVPLAVGVLLPLVPT